MVIKFSFYMIILFLTILLMNLSYFAILNKTFYGIEELKIVEY